MDDYIITEEQENDDIDPELLPNMKPENADKMLKLKSRIFWFSQNTINPQTGETLITEARIKKGLAHKTIMRWAYVLHDKDTYTEDDIKQLKKKEPDRQIFPDVGDAKTPHYHVLIQASQALTIQQISKWFDVPANFIQLKKGRSAILDCAAYLVHETDKAERQGKHHYSDDEVHANFDFRAELTRRAVQLSRYGSELSEKEDLRMRVLNDGLTLTEAMRSEPVLFADDLGTLQKLRGEYLCRNAKLPALRLNFYISGEGGIGKDELALMLANIWYPDKDIDDIVFNITDLKSGFNGYDGQPVIIWSDVRASDLIGAFGRYHVFDMLDVRPKNTFINVKYSKTRLINEINILTGPDSYVDFLNGLAGEYTDRLGNFHKSENKAQSYRRFPVIIEMSEDVLKLLVNNGFMCGSRDYETYKEYERVRMSFQMYNELPDTEKQKVLNRLTPHMELIRGDVVSAAQKIVDDIDTEEVKKLGTSVPGEFLLERQNAENDDDDFELDYIEDEKTDASE